MALSETDRVIREGATVVYQATLQDEDGDAIALGDITTLTLTYYNQADASIINSRSEQDVLNANNVAVSDAGVLTWSLQPDDTVIVNTTLTRGQKETHLALFELTWDSGDKVCRYEVTFEIEQINEVPLSAGATLISSYGGSGSNTYCSLTQANSYITTAVLNKSSWESATVASKAAALMEATRDIDSRSYIYGRYYSDQTLKFPRSVDVGLEPAVTATSTTLYGVTYTQQMEDVRRACCHQALWLLRNAGQNVHLETMAAGVKKVSKKMGPIAESYEYTHGAVGGGGANPLCSESRQFLVRWMSTPRIIRG